MTSELSAKLEATKKALEQVEALGITPMDLLAYALTLDAQAYDEDGTVVELVQNALESELDDPRLGEELYVMALEFAQELSK